MDTQAYLLKHGWRGTGHSLDTTNKGLRKPLLISKKVDVLGIGINKHDVISDQWWLKAFDSSLKDFGTGKKSLLGQVREHGVKRGGLYSRFVQGESEGGTLERQGGKRKAEDDVEEKRGKKVKTGKKGKSKTSSSSSSSTKTSDTEMKKGKTLDGLPADKRAAYASRAAAKNLSLEDYFSLRTAKNLEAKTHRRRQPTSEPVSSTTTTTKATKSRQKPSKKEEAEISGKPLDKKEQKILTEKILQAARRKLNGEVVAAEEKRLPDVLVTTREADFTKEERDAATKAAKRFSKVK